MSETPNGIIPVNVERWFTRLLHPIAAFLSRIGVSPDAVSIVGLFFGLLAGLVLAFDHLHWGLIVLVLMGSSDIVDGEIAKISGRTTRFGAILDSTFDRYTDFLLLCGLGIRFWLLNEPWWILITALALMGTFQVSYVKARAEGKGWTCPIGLMQRSERLILIGLGLLFGGWILKAALLFLTGFANYTAVQRLLYLKTMSRNENETDQSENK